MPNSLIKMTTIFMLVLKVVLSSSFLEYQDKFSTFASVPVNEKTENFQPSLNSALERANKIYVIDDTHYVLYCNPNMKFLGCTPYALPKFDDPKSDEAFWKVVEGLVQQTEVGEQGDWNIDEIEETIKREFFK